MALEGHDHIQAPVHLYIFLQGGQFSQIQSHTDIRNLPNLDQAVQMYRASGGHITDPESFGNDPTVLDAGKKII